MFAMLLVYKHRHRVDELNELETSNRFERMRRCEKIADELCEIEMYHLALDYYLQMADHASNVDRNAFTRAIMSVAATAYDAGKYDIAYVKYKQLLTIEREHGVADDKV